MPGTLCVCGCRSRRMAPTCGWLLCRTACRLWPPVPPPARLLPCLSPCRLPLLLLALLLLPPLPPPGSKLADETVQWWCTGSASWRGSPATGGEAKLKGVNGSAPEMHGPPQLQARPTPQQWAHQLLTMQFQGHCLGVASHRGHATTHSPQLRAGEGGGQAAVAHLNRLAIQFGRRECRQLADSRGKLQRFGHGTRGMADNIQDRLLDTCRRHHIQRSVGWPVSVGR